MSHEVAPPNVIAVSIIVPVYNVEAYVADCLESILAQTFRETCEIIVIDNCSSDDSAAICRQFRDAHPNYITLLENPANTGVSGARHRALDIMRGRYFLFVDPSDLLPPTALGALYLHNKVRGHAGGKLFRREPLGHFRFLQGVGMVEDLYYCSEVFAHADSLLLLNQSVYHYRYRESGAAGQKNESGSYLEWPDTVELSVHFASTTRQNRAHRVLMVRTMSQLARECRKLPQPLVQKVLAEIATRCRKWDISPGSVIRKHYLGLRSIGHCIKMQFAIRDIRRKLVHREI